MQLFNGGIEICASEPVPIGARLRPVQNQKARLGKALDRE
jgi:hypothetical protein